MERDEALSFWFRRHPGRGWQMWNGLRLDDRWYDFDGRFPPGSDPTDRFLSWEDTWCEPEAD